MAAGRLAEDGFAPDGLVLIAPGSVIKDACPGGKFFTARFDPQDPPQVIRCWGFMKLGREYLLTTQQLDIFGTAAAFEGPVRILHGTRDRIVPMRCSETYAQTYGDRSELVVVEGENHTITRKRKEVAASVVAFFKKLWQK
jgi:pimeloyl-ACP methyl ester carboxylesterase